MRIDAYHSDQWISRQHEKLATKTRTAEIIAHLNQKSFQEYLGQIAPSGDAGDRELLLLYPVCRYADEETMAQTVETYIYCK